MKITARERAHQIAERNKLMKAFGRLPSGLEKWADKELFADATFLAFNNKTGKAHCSVCDTEFDITKKMKLKHNQTGVCPVCGSKVTYHRDTVDKGRYSIKWALVVQRHGEDLLLRYLCITKEYSNAYRKHELTCTETIRTLMTAKKSHSFQYNYDINGWLPYKDTWNVFYQPTVYDIPKKGLVIYKPEKLRQTLKGTWAEYSGAEIIALENHIDYPYLLEQYIEEYRHFPAIEKLTRVGFIQLIGKQLSTYSFNPVVAPEAPDLRSALGLSAYQMKLLLRKKDPSADALRLVKDYPNISIELFELLSSYSIYTVKDIMEFGKYGNIVKMLKYIEEQRVRIYDYRDHLRQLEELGMNFTGTHLFPENFSEKHQELTARVNQRREEKKAEEIASWSAMIHKKYMELMQIEPLQLKEHGLLITFPKSYDDLKFEGDTLHHCVRTYADKIATGETMVFFIRRESEPDVPYYTLEWCGGHIVQCRGKYNQSATGQVLNFAEHFNRELSTHYNIHLAA